MSKEDGKWKRIGTYTHKVSDIKKPIKYTLNEHPLSLNHCYYFRYEKKTYKGSTGETDIEDSQTRVKEIIYSMTHGGKKKSEQQKTLKFENVVKLFLTYKKTQPIKPKTLHEYRRQSKYLIEYFKGRDINTLDTKKIYTDYFLWRKNYYKTHKNKSIPTYKKNGAKIKGRRFESISDTSIDRENRLLCSILIYSKEDLKLLNGVDIPKYTIRGTSYKVREPLSWSDYCKLKEYWEKKNPYYWKIISFVDKTGIRYPSELLNILVKDVNLRELPYGSVLIRNRKSMKNKVINNRIPLNQETRDILEQLLSRTGIPKNPNDPVFVDDKGLQIKYINKSFKKSLIELGINPNLTMYSLRHTYVTRMLIRNEYSMKMLSTMLGHRDTTMVDKIYSHLGDDDIMRTTRRIEEEKKKNN